MPAPRGHPLQARSGGPARPCPRGSVLALGALGAVLAAGACDSGAIGNSGPGSNGQSFVSGSPGTTVYGG